MSKRGTIQQKYSAEFKIGVIMDMREHHMGYRETVRKYWNVSKGQEANYKNAVQRWERIYLEEGAEGLMRDRRGKTCSDSGTRKGRPPKLDKKVEEDLIAENAEIIMTKAGEDMREMEERLTKGMSEQEIETFRLLLNKVMRNIGIEDESVPQDIVFKEKE